MVTEEILLAGIVKDITEVIGTYTFPENTLVLMERLPQQVVAKSARRDLLYFIHLDTQQNVDTLQKKCADYTSGRIFHPHFELRWEKHGGETHVVYLGHKDALNLLKLEPVEDVLDQCKVQTKRYSLFGERLRPELLRQMGESDAKNVFAEVRVPRLLYYPAPPHAQRVQIVVREYVHAVTGQLILFRFEKLVPELEGKRS